jgi:hypothetical protein
MAPALSWPKWALSPAGENARGRPSLDQGVRGKNRAQKNRASQSGDDCRGPGNFDIQVGLCGFPVPACITTGTENCLGSQRSTKFAALKSQRRIPRINNHRKCHLSSDGAIFLRKGDRINVLSINHLIMNRCKKPFFRPSMGSLDLQLWTSIGARNRMEVSQAR